MSPSASHPSRKASVPALLACAFAFALTAICCVPLRTYVANVAEFEYGFAAAWPRLLGLTASTWAAAVLIGIASPLRGAALWLSLALCVWLQSAFLVWDYGVFDGKGIAWERYSWQGYLDLAVWAVLIALMQWRARVLGRQLTWIALVFAALQIGSVAIEARKASQGIFARPERSTSDDFRRITRYGASQNVVHVLMDAYQTDVFLETVTEDGLEDAFEGFAVFRDNLSACAWTQLCLPSIFGGEVYDGRVTTSEFIDRALGEQAFSGVLREHGFVVNMIPFIAMENAPYDNYFVSPRVYGKSQREQAVDEQMLLLDVGLFRVAPHLLRRWVYNDGNWRISRIAEPPTTRSFHQKAFLADYTAALRVEGEQPRYHFVHLFPPHLPYVTNEDGSFAGKSLANTRENYKTEARWILHGTADLMRRLQELEIYDDALIIVQGDHGSTHPPRFDGRIVPIHREGYAGLLAIKQPGATGAMRISSVPSSHADIPATVLLELGLESPYAGPSLFAIEEGAQRVRRFFEPHWEENEMELFEVRGSAHDPGAWSSLGRRRIGERASAYAWGTPIVFSMDGNAGLYLDRGWSYPDEGFIWNSGTSANLRVAIEPASDDVHFYVMMRPFLVPGRLDAQRVELAVNGEALAQWRLVGQPPLLHAVIPRRLLDGPELDIALRTPDATTPRAVGVGQDDRLLAISVREMKMTLQPIDRR